MFIQALLNGAVQVILFAFLPLVVWMISARKKEKFFSWIGIKKPAVEDRKKWWLSMLVIFAVCLASGELAVFIRGPMETADSAYMGLGAAAIPSIFAYAFIQTGLSEEIIFRGFLVKRLAAIFGFAKANAVQAAMFGVIHLLMVFGLGGQVSFLAGLVIVVYPVIPAALFAYADEKLSGGSILPGWFIHGALNAVTGIMAAFA